MASIFLLNAINDEILQLRFLCFVSPCQKPAVDYLKEGGRIEQLEFFRGLRVVSCLRLGLLKVQRQPKFKILSQYLSQILATLIHSLHHFQLSFPAKSLCFYNLLVSILFHPSKIISRGVLSEL